MTSLVLIVGFVALVAGLLVADQIRVQRRRTVEHGYRAISMRASTRLQFRQPTRKDKDFFLEMAADSTAAENNGWRVDEVEHVRRRFDDRKKFKKHRAAEMVAFERATGTCVGTATFSPSPLDPDHGRSVGVHVHRDHRDKGYGREIMAAAIVLLQVHPEPVHVGTLVDNHAMQRVMAELGYARLDETRPYEAPNGMTYDSYWYDCSASTHPPVGLHEL